MNKLKILMSGFVLIGKNFNVQNSIFTLLFLFAQLCFAQVEVNKKQSNSPIELAEYAYQNKDFVASINQYELAFKDQTNQTGRHYYNAACSAALAGQKEKAWKYLELALSNGFNNYPHIFKDVDLVTLHDDAKWKKLQDEKEFNIEKIKKAFAEYSKTAEDLMQLVPFKKDRLWGYMQRGTKKILIQPMLQEAGFFQKHRECKTYFVEDQYYIELKYNDNRVYIKPNSEILTKISCYEISDGMVISPPPPDEINSGSISTSFRPKADKEGLGFTEQLGTIVSYSKNYDEFEELIIDNQFYAKVKYKGLHGIINKDGKPYKKIFDIRYKSFYRNQRFNNLIHLQDAQTEKWNIANIDGTLLIHDLDVEPNFFNHDEPSIIIKKNGKFGLMQLDGTTTFFEGDCLSMNKCQFLTLYNGEENKTQKWSLFTPSGKKLLDGLDEPINYPVPDLIYFKKAGKFGIMRLDGSLIFAPKYDATTCERAYAYASDEKKYVYYLFVDMSDTTIFYIDENGVEYR